MKICEYFTSVHYCFAKSAICQPWKLILMSFSTKMAAGEKTSLALKQIRNSIFSTIIINTRVLFVYLVFSLFSCALTMVCSEVYNLLNMYAITTCLVSFEI